jgi:hypothetical protein
MQAFESICKEFRTTFDLNLRQAKDDLIQYLSSEAHNQRPAIFIDSLDICFSWLLA